MKHVPDSNHGANVATFKDRDLILAGLLLWLLWSRSKGPAGSSQTTVTWTNPETGEVAPVPYEPPPIDNGGFDWEPYIRDPARDPFFDFT